MTTWRDRARPIIAEVLRETAGQPENVIRKALIDAFPFGPMQYHPYKIWRSEVRRQLGVEKPKERGAKPIQPADPRQQGMF